MRCWGAHPDTIHGHEFHERLTGNPRIFSQCGGWAGFLRQTRYAPLPVRFFCTPSHWCSSHSLQATIQKCERRTSRTSRLKTSRFQNRSSGLRRTRKRRHPKAHAQQLPHALHRLKRNPKTKQAKPVSARKQFVQMIRAARQIQTTGSQAIRPEMVCPTSCLKPLSSKTS